MQIDDFRAGQLVSAVLLVHYKGELRAVKRWAWVEEVHPDRVVVNFEDGGGLVTLPIPLLAAFQIES